MNLTVGGTGNIVNLGEMIANTIATTNAAMEQAKAPDDLRTSLEALRGPVTEAAAKLPSDEARNLLEDYETFTKQALRPSPSAGVVKAQGESIVGAVSKIAGLATPIVGLVAAVVKALGFA